MPGGTVTLAAVPEADVLAAWRRIPLDQLVLERPRGRLASLLSGPVDGLIVDGTRTAATSLAGLPVPAKRRVYDALIEDCARAMIVGAPLQAISEIFHSLGQLGRWPELEASRLDGDASPAYPAELLEAEPTWMRWIGSGDTAGESGEPMLPLARAQSERLRDLGPGAFPTQHEALWSDLVETLTSVLAAAAAPGGSLLAAYQR
jgi:hypothetical protein